MPLNRAIGREATTLSYIYKSMTRLLVDQVQSPGITPMADTLPNYPTVHHLPVVPYIAVLQSTYVASSSIIILSTELFNSVGSMYYLRDCTVSTHYLFGWYVYVPKMPGGKVKENPCYLNYRLKQLHHWKE